MGPAVIKKIFSVGAVVRVLVRLCKADSIPPTQKATIA
jgi:hypothetical protein